MQLSIERHERPPPVGADAVKAQPLRTKRAGARTKRAGRAEWYREQLDLDFAPKKAAKVIRLPVEQPPTMPRVRGQCEGGEGICLSLLCKFNTTLDILPSGSIRLNAPKGEIPRTLLRKNDRWTTRHDSPLTPADHDRFDDAVIERLASLERNCVLDIVEHAGAQTLKQVADQMGLHKQGIDKMESDILAKLGVDVGLEDMWGESDE